MVVRWLVMALRSEMAFAAAESSIPVRAAIANSKKMMDAVAPRRFSVMGARGRLGSRENQPKEMGLLYHGRAGLVRDMGREFPGE